MKVMLTFTKNTVSSFNGQYTHLKENNLYSTSTSFASNTINKEDSQTVVAWLSSLRINERQPLTELPYCSVIEISFSGLKAPTSREMLISCEYTFSTLDDRLEYLW